MEDYSFYHALKTTDDEGDDEGSMELTLEHFQPQNYKIQKSENSQGGLLAMWRLLVPQVKIIKVG